MKRTGQPAGPAVWQAGGPAEDSASPVDLLGFDRDLVTKAGAENFPVASRLLPARVRGDLLRVYRFARLVDDVGDEAPPEARLRLLDEIAADVDRMYAGGARLGLLRELAATVRRHGIPAAEFHALIEANRRDQRVSRYRDFAELLDYCTLSANPVGHIVLRLFGAATPRRLALADRVCTGLQLVEHCQDVAEDYRRGRVYLPRADLERFDCAETDLVAAATPRVRDLMAYQTERALRLLDEGAPLISTLRGTARLAVAGYVAGGRAAAAAIRAAAYDVTRGAPRPAVARVVAEWVTALARGR